MKLLKIASGITLVLAAAGLLIAQADTALQKAIRKETVEGDLKGAIEQYKKLAQGSNRAIAAQALIHMGECYEKLGSKDAAKQYDLVISKFADQKEAVAQARAHLGGAAAKASGMAARLLWEMVSPTRAWSLSADSRYIAFTDWSVDGARLALHDLSTGTNRFLTEEDGTPGDATFSPDGKQLAYIWRNKQDSDLRIISLSGTGPAVPRVFKNADWNYSFPGWSPDGKLLAVTAGPAGKPRQRLLVSVRDGSFRALKSVFAWGSDPWFSPDGKYLAYERSTGGPNPKQDVFVLDIDRDTEIQAVDWPGRDKSLGWSPDGKHLLFASDRSGSMGLWDLPFADGKAQGPPVLIRAGIGVDGPAGVTSSGALYYLASSGGTVVSYLQVAPFDFAAGRILSPPLTVGASGPSYGWSPDGKYLAYGLTGGGSDPSTLMLRSTETGQSQELRRDIANPGPIRWASDSRTLVGVAKAGREIYKIDAQTKQLSTVDVSNLGLRSAEVVTGNSMPAWSPDQKKLYVQTWNLPIGGDGSVGLVETNADFGNPREIVRWPKGTSLFGVNFLPDARSIVTISRDDATKSEALVSIPIAGGAPQELYRRQGVLGDVFFSPDGKYFAVVSGGALDHPAPALLFPAAGGQPQELLTSTPPLVVSWGMWAPDSRSLFLRKSTPDNQRTELWRVPVYGGQPVKLDVNANLDDILGSNNQGGFSVSPDGRQIAFIRGARNSPKNEFWVMENFLPPAK